MTRLNVMFISRFVFVIEGHFWVNVVMYLVFLGDHTDLVSFPQVE